MREGLADEVDRRVRALAQPTTEPIRAIRRQVSREVREGSGDEVVALALELVDRHRWVAYELVHHHPQARAQLDAALVERLGAGIDSWPAVDSFGRYVSGPAWLDGNVADEVVLGWTASPDRWWRRAALVTTVPLNLAAAGGTGDTTRTLAVCERLVTDRDDMVVKAVSWALRQLSTCDPDAVLAFLEGHDGELAPRVRREVTTKLRTGRKAAPRGRAFSISTRQRDRSPRDLSDGGTTRHHRDGSGAGRT